jgi:hypothetical protein
MAAETTRTSLTEIVNSEAIQDLILMYGYDKTVISPLCRVADLRGRSTAVASFPQWELDAVSDITTEGTTTLSNVELQTTEVATITAAAVGVLRHVTMHASATNMLGADGLMRFIVEDGARLCVLELENDLAATFSGFSNSVGQTGTDLSIANFVEAIAKMDAANARGRRVAVLDDQAASDLRTAISSTTGTVFAGAPALQSVLNANSDAFVGVLFDVPIWLTNLTDTANTNADVVSAMFVDGAASPEYAALGIALLWEPTMQAVAAPEALAEQVAISMAYGVGRISAFGVKIVTDA